MLKRLEITKLFGYKRDIIIDFNKDITLIIGRNGSGKTTVLNIMNSIISGKFNFLSKYKFHKLTLSYTKGNMEKEIYIEFKGFAEVLVRWNNQEYLFKLENESIYSSRYFKRDYTFEDTIFGDDIEMVFEEISNDFKKVYLPLNRNIGNRNRRFDNEDIFEFEDKNENIMNLDESLKIVDALVKQKQLEIMLKFNNMNREMQKEMFKSSFTFDETAEIDLSNLSDMISILKSKTELEVAFKEMGMLDKNFTKQIDKFYRKLEEAYANVVEIVRNKDNSTSENSKYISSFIQNSSQVSRIIGWKEIVVRRNKRKDSINKPMETFFNTLNSYLEDSGKKIEFSNKESKLLFSTNESNGIPTKYLSSGEKHIIIFFAYLILGMNENKDGIFIVDEPELSLHMKWQERFSSDLLKVAPNLQIIFATHSPEIVGEHRRKIVILGGDHA